MTDQEMVNALRAELVDLRKRFDEVNTFSGSQCEKMLIRLSEKDKQLAAAVECIRGVEEAIRFQRPSAVMVAIAKWRGLQSTVEQPTTPATPSWAAQFERRFAGEVHHDD